MFKTWNGYINTFLEVSQLHVSNSIMEIIKEKEVNIECMHYFVLLDVLMI